MVATQEVGARSFPIDVLERAPSPRSLRRLLVGLDAGAAAIAWFVAALAAQRLAGAAGSTTSRAILIAAGMASVTVLGIGVNRLYLARVCSVRAFEVARLARVASISAVVAYVALTMLEVRAPTRIAIGGATLAFVLLATERAAFGSWLRNSRVQGRRTRSLLLVGTDDEALRIHRLLRDHPETGYRIIGLVGGREAAAGFDLPWSGPLEGTLDAVRRTGAAGVVVAASAVPPSVLNDLLRRLLQAGVHVHLSSGLQGFDHRRIRSLPLAYEPLFYLEPVSLARWQIALKRAVDILVASVVLVLTSPVLLAAAAAIKVSDRGPVLFRHTRVGRNGEPFMLAKLRTMVPDAEERLVSLLDLNERHGPLFKISEDPRVTRVGRILRATSVDELPQLFNVLRGEMSLVGPRPALPQEVEQFDDELLSRQQVLPGVTGLWQVEARDNPSFDVYRRLDLFYVDNWSLALDLAILLGTARELVARTIKAIARSTTEDAPAAELGMLE